VNCVSHGTSDTTAHSATRLSTLLHSSYLCPHFESFALSFFPVNGCMRNGAVYICDRFAVCYGQDLSLYINEVKRDRETIEQIEEIEKRLVD